MFTEHPNYGTIQTFAESMILTIRNKQAEFFTKYKRYFQGLRTPAVGTLDGSTLADIQYGLKPDDQAYSWNDFDSATFKRDVKFPIHVSVGGYTGPSGPGWILQFELWREKLGPDGYGHEGNHWVYQHHEGPEKRVGIWDEWFIIEEEEV
jgi:hypothetical protein